MPGYLTTGKRIAYIRLRPMLAGGGTRRALFLRQRAANGISDVTHTSAAEMCSAIQSSAASALSPTMTILTFELPGGRIGREPLQTTKTFSRRRAATR
jgi:hypothetical protein